jgi:hypothetical protein
MLTYRRVLSIVSHRKRRPGAEPLEKDDCLTVLDDQSLMLSGKIRLEVLIARIGIRKSRAIADPASFISSNQGVFIHLRRTNHINLASLSSTPIQLDSRVGSYPRHDSRRLDRCRPLR